MGNTDSRKVFKHGVVNVAVDHLHYQAGDKITGTVTYKLTEAYPG